MDAEGTVVAAEVVCGVDFCVIVTAEEDEGLDVE